MELLDIYDAQRNKTGKTAPRGVTRPPEELQLVIHVCFFDEDGRMLIQQRSNEKDNWSGLWDVSVAGSVLHGEDSQSAAEREVKEELGYTFSLDGVRPSMTINFDLGFDDIYLIEEAPDISKLQLQEDEVRAVKWATQEEIYTLIDTEAFLPYRKSVIASMFEMRKSMGFFDDE
jgi:isopentenyldiphosphate isomerase